MGEQIHLLFDSLMQSLREQTNSRETVGVSVSAIMNDKWYVTGCDDKLIRIWCIRDGALLRRLASQHASEITHLSVAPCIGGRSACHLLSASFYDEDKAFRLYECDPDKDPNSWRSVACFKLDGIVSFHHCH